jgi:hypothetical protein
MFTSFTFGAIRESDPRLNLFSPFTGHLNMNEDRPGNCRVKRQRAVTIPFDRLPQSEIAAQENMGYKHSRNVNRQTLNETAYTVANFRQQVQEKPTVVYPSVPNIVREKGKTSDGSTYDSFSNNYFTIMRAKIIFPGKLVFVLPLPLPLLLPELD